MIVNNASLVTLWPNEPLIEGALVAVESKSIVDFGKIGKLVDRYDDPDVLDVAGRVVMPGMVNVHTRLSSSLAMTRPPVTGLHARDLRIDWESALNEETIYWSALVGLLDSIRSGVTTVFAFHSSPACVERSLEAVSRAFRETGLRGSVAYGVSPRSDAELGVRENVRHIEACRNDNNELLTGLVGLEVTERSDDAMIQACVQAASVVDTRLHVVCGSSDVARLEALSVFERGGLCVVGGELAPGDEKRLAQTGTFLAHAPQSNLLGGLPSSDLLAAASARLQIALGTDGVGNNVLDDFRVSAFRQIARGRTTVDAVRLAYRAVFTGNAAFASAVFGRQVGLIKPGARADLVVWDYRPFTPVAESNLPEHLLWGVSQSAVHTVIVNGRIVYHNGRFATLDEERIRARAREVATRSWERI